MSHAWVRGSVVAAVVNEFSRRGGDAGSVLNSHGLKYTLLEDPDAAIPLARYVGMFENMAARLGDTALGARLGLATQPAHIGPAGLVMARSRSILAALGRLTRFLNSVQPGTQSAFQENDGLVVWTYRIADPAIWPRRQDAEFTVASLIRLIRSSFIPDWRPLLAQFEHAPATPAEGLALQRLLGCQVRFKAGSNGLMFPVEEAHRRFRDEDADLIAVLERYLGDLTSADSMASNWTERVQALISSYLGQQPVTIGRLAADLSTSPRSLQRRLAEEGASLRQLLRDHRRELASQHLQTDALRLSSLAETLGYSDGTTFWRAHRNWTGQSPSALRGKCR